MRLILEAPLDPVAVLARIGPPKSHFGQRAAERGIQSVPGDVLRLAVRWAVQNDRIEYVERMFRLPSGVVAYRFRVVEGLYFALVGTDGIPVTLYTADMLAEVRLARKVHKRAGRRRNKPHKAPRK
ncbi:hypothetical protein ACGYK5_17090 [Sulfitobacter sp. 1A16787]|uniref:hypothetical protein n=1 Tax=Sulfitobacter sp. 1A16787 TaxID=3368571 RepID=UPI003747569E